MIDTFPRGPVPTFPYCVRILCPPRRLLRNGALVALAALVCVGCASHEAVTFNARGDQQAIVRDGLPAIVSRRANSVVLVRPASREFRGGARPVFTVAINNLSHNPLDFRVANVQVTQTVNNEPRTLKSSPTRNSRKRNARGEPLPRWERGSPRREMPWPPRKLATTTPIRR